MSKWNWAFGNVLVSKFKWAVTAGDQDPESEDDKKCGDHYIDKSLECHDGDAHRPDPGNNPYFQGGRKGPPGEDAGGKGKSEDGSRDRREVTKKAKKKESDRAERGEESTPERMAKFAEDTLNDFMDGYGDVDWDSDHGQKLLNELAEMSIRQTAREHAGQFDQRASKKYLPGRDHEDNRSDPGVGPREMFRPGLGDKPITFEAPEHGTPVKVPMAPGQSVFRDLIDRARSGRGQQQEAPPEKEPRRKEAIEHTKKKGEPSQEMKDEQDKWEGPGYEGEEAPKKKGDKPYEYQERQVDEWDPEQSPEEAKPYMQKERRRQTQKDYKRKKDAKKKKKAAASSIADTLHWDGPEYSLASDMNWSAESKIMMDRADPKPGDPGCPSEEDLLALNSALPPLPGDSAEGRPCGDGEDPEQGHCKGPGGPASPAGPAGPMSDDPKVLRKMGGKPPAPPKDVGLGIPEDPQRKARTATQTQLLMNSDPKDSKRTAWAVSKLFPGSSAKQTEKGLSGTSMPMEPNRAKSQYDDAQHSMEQSGWNKTSEMQGRSMWNKGGANVSLSLRREPGYENAMSESGQFVNQFLVHTPKAAPKKRGLFGR